MPNTKGKSPKKSLFLPINRNKMAQAQALIMILCTKKMEIGIQETRKLKTLQGQVYPTLVDMNLGIKEIRIGMQEGETWRAFINH